MTYHQWLHCSFAKFFFNCFSNSLYQMKTGAWKRMRVLLYLDWLCLFIVCMTPEFFYLIFYSILHSLYLLLHKQHFPDFHLGSSLNSFPIFVETFSERKKNFLNLTFNAYLHGMWKHFWNVFDNLQLSFHTVNKWII